MKKILLMAALAAIVTSAQAAEVRILQGDTLWGITEATGRVGAEWPALWAENPQLLKPIKCGRFEVVWIYPGQILRLPAGWELKSLDSSKLEFIQTAGKRALALDLEKIHEWAYSYSWIFTLAGLCGLLVLLCWQAWQRQAAMNNCHSCPWRPQEPGAQILGPNGLPARGDMA